MSSVSTVVVNILGKEYQVSCPEEEVEALTKSARYLDQKMEEIRARAEQLVEDPATWRPERSFDVGCLYDLAPALSGSRAPHIAANLASHCSTWVPEAVQDKILSVNGHSTQGLSHSEAIAIFKSIRQGKVTVHIARRDSNGSNGSSGGSVVGKRISSTASTTAAASVTSSSSR